MRDILRDRDEGAYCRFLEVVEQCSPVLDTVADVFPDFTRHDPSHVIKLESLVLDLLSAGATAALTTADLLCLLSAIWLHDTGLGDLPDLRARRSATLAYQEGLALARRRGLSEDDYWREYARANHHSFCSELVEDLCPGLSPFERHWVGEVARSHGERTLHDRQRWPGVVAVGDQTHVRPPVLAVALRLADILHLNEARAPEYLLEHRGIENAVSIAHWRAHQCVADVTVDADTCYFDGVTADDEAYWFAQQFIEAMNDEVEYCARQVLATLDAPFNSSLRFRSVRSRIVPTGFVAERPVRLGVNGPRLLSDLLADALYKDKPAWIRELLQNAFDACRDRAELDPAHEPSVRICLDIDTGVLEVTDSGVGMTGEVVANHLFVAGSSYWSSDEYRRTRSGEAGHVGAFGIGFMSIFAVADEVRVATMHHSEKVGAEYLIRAVDRLIRVESSRRDEPGTSVSVRLPPARALSLDLAKLVEDHCTFPEFRVEVEVDGEVVLSLEPRGPELSDGPKLRPITTDPVRSRMLSAAMREEGVTGSLHVPMIYVECLDAFVPDMRGWLRAGGWTWEGEPSVSLGGVRYGRLHTLGGSDVFSHVPSVGVLRLAASPAHFQLEMTLARDTLAPGPETRRLHRAACGFFDRALAQGLVAELDGTDDPEVRSAIVATFSRSLLNLWLGNVPRLGASLDQPDLHPPPETATLFPELTRIAASELLLGVVDASGDLSRLTIDQLREDGACVFSPGLADNRIPPPVAEAIFAFEPKAKLLVILPEPDFGILELRHWAKEELLVPVLSHGRCAFGLRLCKGDRPYPFFPSELTRVGVPVAAGPLGYAVLDHRDLMAEAKAQPTGGPRITAVLNRAHPGVSGLISALEAFDDLLAFRRSLGPLRHKLWAALDLGTETRFSSHAGDQLASVLSEVAEAVGTSLELEPAAVPSYFNAGEASLLGRFAVAGPALEARAELGRYDRFGTLA